jgi:hypothetical protein
MKKERQRTAAKIDAWGIHTNVMYVYYCLVIVEHDC